MFALDEDVTALEALLDGLVDNARAALLVQLAWFLRERDTLRAHALADEARPLLTTGEFEEGEAGTLMARLDLVECTEHLLLANLDEADRAAMNALDGFTVQRDHIGIGDTRWLQASLFWSRGQREPALKHLEMAALAYALGDDALRMQAAKARTLGYLAFTHPAKSSAGLIESFSDAAVRPAWLIAWIEMAKGHSSSFNDDPGSALKHYLESFQTARATSQFALAVNGAANAADVFETLGDLDAALDWGERALALARSVGWPASVGTGLRKTADVLRLLGRHDQARVMLKESLEVMEPLAGSRNLEAVLESLGQLALDMHHYQEAIAWFMQFSKRGDPDLLIKSWCGQAVALSRLGMPDEALVYAKQSLDLAKKQESAEETVRVLRVFAEIHRNHKLAPPPGITEESIDLYYLREALALTQSIEGYAVPADLHQQIALAYAATGDYQAAYEALSAAAAARNQMRSEDADKRALAMSVRHEIERTRVESEHHMKLAATLQETNATLETLGKIGREITGSLDAGAAFEALHRHANLLLDAASFGIYLLDPSGTELSLVFGREKNVSPDPVEVANDRVSIDSDKSYAARCARTRQEIVINARDDSRTIKARTTIPGTLPTTSLLFAPLEVGKRLLGVMTIQSPRPNAYGERDCSIFRTLCAYGAIALDNSAAYSAVEAARENAARQEQELRVAAAAFESQEGMIITNSRQVIMRVNGAFTHITGYSAEEVVGRHPAMFRSGRHDSDYYAAMGDSVRLTGNWQGEVWTRRKNGETFPMWLAITAVRSEEGVTTHYVFALIDITERKVAEDEIRNLAFYDPLTNLPNRRLLMDRLRQALAKSARNGAYGALVFVDLDNFKRLNDTRGHDVGDMLLERVAERLTACLRETDTVARLGGDEFVILIEALGDVAIEAGDRVEIIAKKVLATLTSGYELNGKQEHSTPSIGVCLFQGQAVPVDELLKQADLAMYQAKAAGRNAIRFFDPTMQALVSAHAALETDMRQALLEDQFMLYYQPQVDDDGRVIGAEALVRWRHPERGMVSPGEFIPLAEETGLILPLGQWVLETACKQLSQWARRPETAHLSLAVNISARQFHDANFVNQVLRVLEETRANPRRLKLELTESLLLKEVEGVIATMNVLMAEGVCFSLDDFGTGYSSLAYLKLLPLEQLKIDQSFVRDIFEDANDVAIVRAIVTLGQSLGLSVIAEGVETEEQRAFLLASGCQKFQGYLFGRPGPADEILKNAREASLTVGSGSLFE